MSRCSVCLMLKYRTRSNFFPQTFTISYHITFTKHNHFGNTQMNRNLTIKTFIDSSKKRNKKELKRIKCLFFAIMIS